MEKITIYLDEERNGVSVCPRCGKSKTIQFEAGTVPRSLTLTCSCGDTFTALLEKRQNYRKKLGSYGKYFDSIDAKEGHDIKIIDVSAEGLRFLNLGVKPLAMNQAIKIAFPVKDATVTYTASVSHIKKDEISCKFLNINEHSKKVLGFFLMP